MVIRLERYLAPNLVLGALAQRSRYFPSRIVAPHSPALLLPSHHSQHPQLPPENHRHLALPFDEYPHASAEKTCHGRSFRTRDDEPPCLAEDDSTAIGAGADALSRRDSLRKGSR